MQRWQKTSEETMIENQYLRVKKASFLLPNGFSISDYFLAERGDYVLAVVKDEKGRILLERQYRPAVDDFVYELPAGWIDPGETAEEASKREVKEETGYQAQSITFLGSFYPLAGFIKQEAFVLLVMVHSQEQASPQQEEMEDIQLQWAEEEKLRKLIEANKIKCMGSLAALNLYWNSQEGK